MGVVSRLYTHYTPYVTLNIKRQQLSNIICYVCLYFIQFYRSFEESSIINIVENYNHCLAGIGSHGSSLTLDQIGTIFGSIRVPMVRVQRKQRTFVHIITTLFPFII